MSFHPRAHGFTIIELLVVIAIIGLLSSIILASLNSARAKGNDAARIQTVKSIETALEFYYDKNSTYPQLGAVNTSQAIAGLSSYLVPTFLGSIPASFTTDSDLYLWASGGTGYGLLIYTQIPNTWCKTGVNLPSNLWSAFSACSF